MINTCILCRKDKEGTVAEESIFQWARGEFTCFSCATLRPDQIMLFMLKRLNKLEDKLAARNIT